MSRDQFFKSVIDADSIEDSLACLKDFALNTIKIEHLCMLLKDSKKDNKAASIYTMGFTQAASNGIQLIETENGYFSSRNVGFSSILDTKLKSDEVPENVRKILLKIGFRSVYTFSLENRLSYGALVFCFPEFVQLTPEELEACTLICTHMKQLVEKIQFRKLIVKQTPYENLFNTLKMKDIYTVNHSYNVSFYSMLLGRKFGLEEPDLEKLKIAALLHDIGKIAIPDSILFKPDPLSEQERIIVKKHPVIGYELLKDLPGLEHTLSVVRWHHEQLDGNGYPDQLKENEIPLITKIVTLTDAFDAMTSNRVYHKSLNVQEVEGELLFFAGSQFDRMLVGLFLEIVDEQIKMMNDPKIMF